VCFMAPPRRKTPPHSKWSREQYLVDALAQLEATAVEAEKKESYVAAVNAKHRAILVRAELDQLRETERRQAAPATPEAHKEEILAEVRRLRTGATEAGSYVAAANLLKLERDMLAAQEAERRAEEEKKLLHLGEDALLELIREQTAALPPQVLERLIELLRDRLADQGAADPEEDDDEGES
jgi:hypothetical protein